MNRFIDPVSVKKATQRPQASWDLGPRPKGPDLEQPPHRKKVEIRLAITKVIVGGAKAVLGGSYVKY
jgi:hypothetical protein